MAHIHTEVTPDHTTNALTEAFHITITQALIITTVTCHTEGCPLTEAHPLTPGIAANLEHVLHTNQVRLHLLSLHPTLAGQL